jgi:Pyridoxamine 5'-phosphate oxidase
MIASEPVPCQLGATSVAATDVLVSALPETLLVEDPTDKEALPPMTHDDLAAHARAIIDANLYLTLGTADPDGHPWTSPVCFAPAGDRDFYRGLEAYPRPDGRGGRPVTREEVTAAASYRLYQATASDMWVLCPREPRQPCPLHGLARDHRTRVTAP